MKKPAAPKAGPCSPDDLFVASVTGRLQGAPRRELQNHLRICFACRMRLASFEAARGRLERMFSKVPRRSDLVPTERLLTALLAQIPEKRLYYDTLDVGGFGSLLLAATDGGLCFVSFRPDAAEDYVSRWSRADFTVNRGGEPVALAARQVREYFAGKRKQFQLDLDLHLVSDFTRSVLEETRRIGFGKVSTYQQVAERIGKPHASRAVGNALGKNPIPIVIPCHRVVATGGGLGGFTGGIDYKRKLLSIEGIETGGGELFG
jgi:methylated-DNA-[protein]-cysteine S-methyltransferase